MHHWVIEFLRCPESNAPLKLAESERDASGEVMAGYLVADVDGEGPRYPIVDGVPIFLGDDRVEDRQQTVETFGREWNDFSRWGWIDEAPSDSKNALRTHSGLSADSAQDFLRKTGHAMLGENSPSLGDLVLDAGCGNGRFVREARKFSDRVIGVDASEAAFVARKNLRAENLDGVEIVRGDVLNLPIASGVLSYAFSIGVLQHTGDAARAVSEMARAVRPGARISVNCYGTGTWAYEFIDGTTRAVTTRLSESSKHRVARWLSDFDVWLMSGTRIHRAFERWLRRQMVIRPTVVQMYDWYAPSVANHYDDKEVRAFLEAAGLQILAAEPPIHLSDYDDGARRSIGGSHCILTEKRTMSNCDDGMG